MADRPVRLRHHKVWDNKVVQITGGMTILKPGQGRWVDGQTNLLHHDRVIPVRIACSREQIAQICQFTLMAYLISQEVLIVRFDPSATKG